MTGRAALLVVDLMFQELLSVLECSAKEMSSSELDLVRTADWSVLRPGTEDDQTLLYQVYCSLFVACRWSEIYRKTCRSKLASVPGTVPGTG